MSCTSQAHLVTQDAAFAAVILLQQPVETFELIATQYAIRDWRRLWDLLDSVGSLRTSIGSRSLLKTFSVTKGFKTFL